MNIHDRFESVADLYAAGGLSEEERREVADHAASCDSCGAALRNVQAFAKWAAGAISPDAPPSDLEDRILGRLKLNAPAVSPGWLLTGKILAGCAAAALLCMIGWVIEMRNRPALLEGISARSTGLAPAREARSEASAGAPFTVMDGAFSERHALQAQGGASDYRSWEDTGVTKVPAHLGGFRLGGKVAAGEEAIAVAPPAPPPAAVPEAPMIVTPDAIEDPEFPGLDDFFGPQVSTVATTDMANAAKVNRPKYVNQEGRKIIRNADVRLRVDSYDDTYAAIGRILGEENGFIAGGETQKMENGKVRARITVRVPAEKFDTALAKFRQLGELLGQTLTADDVTKEYVDFSARLSAKEALVERLKKILVDAKGTVKELAAVESQLGETLEAIESIKGQLRYFDTHVRLSTIMLEITERDIEQPFEYVESLKSTIAVTVEKIREAFAEAQKAVTDAGGQVVDAKLTRRNDDSSEASIEARIVAEKFPALREKIRGLGYATKDSVDQRKEARGGKGKEAGSDTPVRKEQAALDITLSSPPVVFTREAQITVRSSDVQAHYEAARKAVEAAGGSVVGGGLSGRTDQKSALVQAVVDADAFAALVADLKSRGEVTYASEKQDVPPPTVDGRRPLIRERGRINLTLDTPPALIEHDRGFGATLRDTFSGSISGILVSFKYLFVGLALAGPWLLLAGGAWWGYRRWKRSRASAQTSA